MKKYHALWLCALLFLLAACSNSKQQVDADGNGQDDATVDDATAADDDTAVPADSTMTGDELLTDGDTAAGDELATDDIASDTLVTDDTVTDDIVTDDATADEDEVGTDDDTPAGLTCPEIQDCRNGCGGDQSCVDDCIAAGTTEAQGEFDALVTCAMTYCATECGSSGTQTACENCATTNCANEVAACYTDENAPVYGTIAVNAVFNYIYDGDSDVNTQIQADSSGVISSSVFTGSYAATDKPIPPTAAGAQTLSLALHYAVSGANPATVRIITQVRTQTGIVNPMVQLQFPNDAITTGTVPLDGGQPGSGRAALVNSTGPNTICLLAYAFGGSVTVTAAAGTNQVSGGSISLNGTGIPLYYPTETPLGDLSGQLGSTQICPKE